MTELRQFVFRFTLTQDGDVLKGFQTHFPAMAAKKKMIGIEVDFGDCMNDQEVTLSSNKIYNGLQK